MNSPISANSAISANLRSIFFGGKPENRGVQIYVFAAREFGIEAGAEFEERRDAAVNRNRPGARLQNAGADLQERAFAASVFPHDAKCFAAVHFEATGLAAPNNRDDICGGGRWLIPSVGRRARHRSDSFSIHARIRRRFGHYTKL